MSEITQTKYVSKFKRANWFEKTIGKYLLDKNYQEKGKRHNGLIRGSSVGNKCLRQLGYMVLGYEKQPDEAHFQYVLSVGNAYHDMIQSWVVNAGLVKAKPYLDKEGNYLWKGNAEGTILDNDAGIIGHYDGLTEQLLPNDFTCVKDKTGFKYLLEFKTISNRTRTIAVFLKNKGTDKKPVLVTQKYIIPVNNTLHNDLPLLEGSRPKLLTDTGNEYYKQMVDTEQLPVGSLLDVYVSPGAYNKLSRPKQEHVEQATYYANKLNADKILIVYIAKDAENSYDNYSCLNLPLKAYEFDIQDEIIKKIKDKADLLWSTIEKKKLLSNNPEDWLPDRLFSPSDIMSECTYCDFIYHCYPNSDIAQNMKHRYTEHKMLGLPISTGKAFSTHSEEEYGLKAVHLVEDK